MSSAADKKEALVKATVELLQEKGFLAGATSSAIAERAGVNRGHVHHYFGSLRDLFLIAMTSEVEAGMTETISGQVQEFVPRYRWYFDLALTQKTAFELTVVLLVDGGGDDFNIMWLIERTRENLRNDIEKGVLPDDTDIDALHIALISLARGYVIHRDKFARELDVLPEELDARVGKQYEQLLRGIVSQPELLKSHKEQTDDQSGDLRSEL